MRSTRVLHARLGPGMMSALGRPDVHPLAVRFHFVPGWQLTMDITDFSLDLFSLAGRNALVTGGNSGLGRAFSLALAKAGADVFAVGLAEDDGTTRRLVKKAGRRWEFMAADITVPGTAATAVHRCAETLGSIDILVNPAGICLLADV